MEPNRFYTHPWVYSLKEKHTWKEVVFSFHEFPTNYLAIYLRGKPLILAASKEFHEKGTEEEIEFQFAVE